MKKGFPRQLPGTSAFGAKWLDLRAVEVALSGPTLASISTPEPGEGHCGNFKTSAQVLEHSSHKREPNSPSLKCGLALVTHF